MADLCGGLRAVSIKKILPIKIVSRKLPRKLGSSDYAPRAIVQVVYSNSRTLDSPSSLFSLELPEKSIFFLLPRQCVCQGSARFSLTGQPWRARVGSPQTQWALQGDMFAERKKGLNMLTQPRLQVEEVHWLSFSAMCHPLNATES